jgi:hypothetical protein
MVNYNAEEKGVATPTQRSATASSEEKHEVAFHHDEIGSGDNLHVAAERGHAATDK